MNPIEENLQKYQLIQDNIIYILTTSLIGINLKLSCYRYDENNNPDPVYTSIFKIEQLKEADQIFQIANDCEDVQWIFEEVILAKSVGILENNGYLDVYFYMRVSGRKAKVILRLNRIQTQKIMIPSNISQNINQNINLNTNINSNINPYLNSKINNISPIINQNINQNINPYINSNNISHNINPNINLNRNQIINTNMNNMSDYQKNQERLTKLQYDANQLINEQNALRKQLSIFFGENEDIKENHERSRSTNQNNKYYNQLNNFNNFQNNNNNVNNVVNLKRVQINDDEDDDIYEVPPLNNEL
jgi:hypothetical protein